MKTFYTADHHFYGRGIIRNCSRPFKNPDLMNRGLIDRWNEVVTSNDVVYVLGDFFWSDKKHQIEMVLDRLNYKKIYLVPGNHDHKKVLRLFRECPGYRIEVLDAIYNKKINRTTRLILSHYALRTWQSSNKGSINLHGHSHGKLVPQSNQLDVGVDTNNFYPYTLEDINNRLCSGGGR